LRSKTTWEEKDEERLDAGQRDGSANAMGGLERTRSPRKKKPEFLKIGNLVSCFQETRLPKNGRAELLKRE
jgi:hypothetical protein